MQQLCACSRQRERGGSRGICTYTLTAFCNASLAGRMASQGKKALYLRVSGFQIKVEACMGEGAKISLKYVMDRHGVWQGISVCR